MTGPPTGGTLLSTGMEATMRGTFNLIRDVALGFLAVVIAAIAAWVAIDYGAALIVVIGGIALVATAIPFVAIYGEEHDLPFNRRGESR